MDITGGSTRDVENNPLLGPFNRHDYAIEVVSNLKELNEGGFVKSMTLESREALTCVYKLDLLDEGVEPLRVEFRCGTGYFLLGDNHNQHHFETMQALLSTLSPKYRQVFAASVSKKLIEAMAVQQNNDSS